MMGWFFRLMGWFFRLMGWFFRPLPLRIDHGSRRSLVPVPWHRHVRPAVSGLPVVCQRAPGQS